MLELRIESADLAIPPDTGHAARVEGLAHRAGRGQHRHPVVDQLAEGLGAGVARLGLALLSQPLRPRGACGRQRRLGDRHVVVLECSFLARERFCEAAPIIISHCVVANGPRVPIRFEGILRRPQCIVELVVAHWQWPAPWYGQWSAASHLLQFCDGGGAELVGERLASAVLHAVPSTADVQRRVRVQRIDQLSENRREVGAADNLARESLRLFADEVDDLRSHGLELPPKRGSELLVGNVRQVRELFLVHHGLHQRTAMPSWEKLQEALADLPRRLGALGIRRVQRPRMQRSLQVLVWRLFAPGRRVLELEDKIAKQPHQSRLARLHATLLDVLG
mmetsp:Transcript_87251/g.244872  ORF Transcript_87251/g.244872 Transcript_87251/m.244872 type:complete len:336 (-) Transcript_87251:1223-2230(-)